MKPTPMALCRFKCSGQFSTSRVARPRSVAAVFEHAGLDTTRAEAAPVRLGEAKTSASSSGIVRLERLAKATENLFVFLLVFFGKDHESGGSEAVLETVQAAALFSGFGLGSAFAAVAAIGFTLTFRCHKSSVKKEMERVLDSARSCLDLRMWVWRFRWVVAVNCLIHGEDIFSRVVNGVLVMFSVILLRSE